MCAVLYFVQGGQDDCYEFQRGGGQAVMVCHMAHHTTTQESQGQDILRSLLVFPTVHFNFKKTSLESPDTCKV